MSSFYENFISFVEYQSGLSGLAKLLSSKTIAPDIIELPKSTFENVQKFVSLTYKLRQLQSYQQHIFALSPEIARFDPGNNSLLMSYDFHIDAQGQPRLVEINTNAAFSLILWYIFEFHKLTAATHFADAIAATFENEYRLNQGDSLKSVVIVDEMPESQKLFTEFLLYQAFLQKRGVQAKIANSTDLLPGKQTLIYNRDTDFYLQSDRVKNLRAAYLARQICLSPNPHEYALLADKDRMLDFSKKDVLIAFGLLADEAQFIESVVLKTTPVDAYEMDELWSLRKGLFFKPRRSFGAKAVYRGNSVSRGVFQKIYGPDNLAQEFVPPGEITVTRDGAPKAFKYDLRFYVYQDQIQLVGARLFQGQVTNFQEDGGGFAPVVFV